MAFGTDGAPRINLFALVVYIPDPLAGFLDDLRKELVAECLPRAHVTILPPRPLKAGQAGTDAAIEQARTVAGGFAPFEIATGEVEIFPTTDVIYIGLQSGERELREMYRALNNGPLAFSDRIVASAFSFENGWPTAGASVVANRSGLTSGRPATSTDVTFWPSYDEICEGSKVGFGICALAASTPKVNRNESTGIDLDAMVFRFIKMG